MFDINKLPETIANKIKGLSWQSDDFGMSGSTILLFDEMVLKIEKIYGSSENGRKLLCWLDGKLPVPKIIEAVQQNGFSFLLMSRLSGEMACSDNSLQNMDDTIKALAKGLKMLWEIDISDCFCNNGIDEKLIQAKYQIENNLVDTDDIDEETLSADGFSDLWDLYNYLYNNKPKQDFVFSHGDFCLPNIFVGGDKITGFIDWGNGGIADRWQDIALCVRSLKHNYMEHARYGEDEYQKYKNLLFKELDLEPDEDKIKYYILLDELF